MRLPRAPTLRVHAGLTHPLRAAAVYVGQAVLTELRRIIEESEIIRCAAAQEARAREEKAGGGRRWLTPARRHPLLMGRHRPATSNLC